MTNDAFRLERPADRHRARDLLFGHVLFFLSYARDDSNFAIVSSCESRNPSSSTPFMRQ